MPLKTGASLELGCWDLDVPPPYFQKPVVGYGNLRKATEDPPRGVPMNIRLSSIANHRPHCSPSPMSRHSEAKADGGEGWGEGELNLRGFKSALNFILNPKF
jgi:hypothetical protein